MTLCIAASVRDKGILAVSDTRFDLQYTSGEGMRKIGRLNRFWHAMFAGADVLNAPAMLAKIEEALEVFARISAEMEYVEVPFEFLVFGFDEKRRPHIFRVSKGGQVDDYRSIGFAAVGSGETAAVHHMLFHEFNPLLPLRNAAYYMCAAKYFAELANLGNRRTLCA